MGTPYEPSPHTRKKIHTRICLKCNKEFKSLGPYNRICEPCNVFNSKFRAATVKDSIPKPKPISE